MTPGNTIHSCRSSAPWPMPFRTRPSSSTIAAGWQAINAYAVPENFGHWRTLVAEIARQPDTLMKLGGLGGRRCGFGFAQRPVPLRAQELAEARRHYIDTCIELFGPVRCMFESNFLPDSAAGSYRTVWNGLKLTVAACSDAEKSALFSGTARRVYRLGEDDDQPMPARGYSS
jgi:L-fuconolactonase